jgi:hypothetical protein
VSGKLEITRKIQVGDQVYTVFIRPDSVSVPCIQCMPAERAEHLAEILMRASEFARALKLVEGNGVTLVPAGDLTAVVNADPKKPAVEFRTGEPPVVAPQSESICTRCQGRIRPGVVHYRDGDGYRHVVGAPDCRPWIAQEQDP